MLLTFKGFQKLDPCVTMFSSFFPRNSLNLIEMYNFAIIKLSLKILGVRTSKFFVDQIPVLGINLVNTFDNNGTDCCPCVILPGVSYWESYKSSLSRRKSKDVVVTFPKS